MVKIETSRFGSLEVPEDRVIRFPVGLLGFPRLNRYILIDYKDTPLKWLQSVEDPDVAFIVTDPKTIAGRGRSRWATTSCDSFRSTGKTTWRSSSC